MNIKFYDLKKQNFKYKKQLVSQFEDFIDSGYYIGGEAVKNFEEGFATFCGAEHALGVGNGLDGLKILLKAYNFPKNAKIIVPASTFVATWLAVSDNELELIPVDVDISTGNLDLDLAKLAIEKHNDISCVIYVHLYGNKDDDILAFKDFLDNRNIMLIEDAAQAHGLIIKDKKAGNIGHSAAFSFYPSKNLGALGDAGAITASDSELIASCKKIANYGSEEKYIHEVIGCNSRLDPIQAIVLSTKLKDIPVLISKRRSIADKYIKALQSNKYIKMLIDDSQQSVFHQFIVRVKNRDHFVNYMKNAGIETAVHYPIPPYSQKCYLYLNFNSDSFPVSEVLSKEVTSIPIGEFLLDEEVCYICEKLKAYTE